MQPAQNALPGCYATALITGASSGLGQAFAHRLLAEGLTVYGTTRDPRAEGLNPAVHWLALDGSSVEGIAYFMSDQNELLTKIDILVNNAGSGSFGKASEQSETSFQGEQNLLLRLPAALSRAVMGGMRERGAGALINISSLAAIFPLPYLASYSSAKAGLSAFTQSLILTEKGGPLVIVDFQAGDYRTAFNANMSRHGQPDAEMERVWRRLEANLAHAPEPGRAAEDLVQVLRDGRSRVFRSGGFFQCHIAPLGVRIFPRRLLLWAIRRYYRIG